MRFILFAFLFLAFVAVVNAQLATQSCATTKNVQPCICNNAGTYPNGCQCRTTGVTGNCVAGNAINCATQCGNGVVNENSNTSFYHITRTSCGYTTGCDAFDSGKNYKTCSEVCDSGTALGTFQDGTCCNRGCKSSRDIGTFDRLNIAPLRCQTAIDCLDAPGHTVTCETAANSINGKWCKYTINAGTAPSIQFSGQSRCPIYPCYTTKWNGSCQKYNEVDNIAKITSASYRTSYWYNGYAYDNVCNQPTSKCWTAPQCYRGTLTAIPTATTVSFAPRPSTPVITNCNAPIPLSSVTNLVTTTPANLDYTWTYESDTCPGTIIQDGDNLFITGVSGSFTCAITTSLRSECNILFNPSPVTVQFNC